MVASRLERDQKNIGVIKTSMVLVSLLGLGFAWLMFSILGVM